MQSSSIEVLWAARYEYYPRKVLRDHRHSYWQLFYILDGTGIFSLNQQTYEIKPELIFLVEANQLHGFSVGDRETLRTIEVKFNLSDTKLQDYIAYLSPVVCNKMTNLKSLFEKIHAEGVQRPLFYQELSSVYLSEIVISIMRELGSDLLCTDNDGNVSVDSVNDSISQMVQDFIHEHYNKDVTLKDIAKSLGYHQGYLCSTFRRISGCTIMKYLYKYRVDKAKELIVYSDYSLKEIAFMVGFRSIHHFTRRFRDIEGLTPGQFRKKERDMVGKDVYFDETFVNHS